MSKYIDFKLIEKKPKTEVYMVRSKSGGYSLGTVKWYGPWRQYCFFAEEGYETIFNRTCLNDVVDFIQELMEERKVRLSTQSTIKEE